MVIRLSRILIDKLFNKMSVNNIDTNKKEGLVNDKDKNKDKGSKSDIINIVITDDRDKGKCVYDNARKNKDTIIKKLDYPYLRYYISEEKIRNNFNNLKKFKPYIIHEKYELRALPHISNLQYTQKEGKTYFLIIDQPDEYKNIEVISDFFNEECRVHCRFISATESVHSFFRTHYIDIIDHLQKEDKDITIENMRETIWSIGPRECSTFKPKLIKFFIELYNARKILDISSGWGDRLIGAMASDIDVYDGFDPNPCLHKNYKNMIEFFKHDVVNKNAVYTIKELPFEEAELKQDYYDLVMTSPPYFTMEIYDDNPETNAKQSIVKIYERGGEEGERLWYNNYLKVWINKCYNALKKGGIIALNINQYKNQHYIYWLLDDMKSSKWTYMGIIGHSKPDKKNPQPTFIWMKAG